MGWAISGQSCGAKSGASSPRWPTGHETTRSVKATDEGRSPQTVSGFAVPTTENLQTDRAVESWS